MWKWWLHLAGIQILFSILQPAGAKLRHPPPHCISCLAGEIQLHIFSILLIARSAPPLGVRSAKAQQLHMNVKKCKGLSRKALLERGEIP